MKNMNINKDSCSIINRFFCNILSKKKYRKSVYGKFDIEHVILSKKADFICNMIKSLNIESVLCRILFWEKDEIIESFLKKQISINEYVIYRGYNNKIMPGICFIQVSRDITSFLKILLTNHFNFELGKMKSLNVRVQICIDTKYNGYLLDIYDDRGFYMYIFRHSGCFSSTVSEY